MILGLPDFIEYYVFGLVGSVGLVIASVSLPWRGAPPKAHWQHWLAAQILLAALAYNPSSSWTWKTGVPQMLAISLALVWV